MPSLLERLGIALPVFQAGMGGGTAGHRLAAAVSEAGGLGTIGILDPPRLRKEIARARALTGAPIAVNLLLPFTRRAHWEAAAEADAVVTFWGTPKRRAGVPWIHQCGSVEEVRAARAAGADAVIAQGFEAGGHVRGTLPALELLERIRAELPGYPVLAAGGIADAADVRTALSAGALAVVAGTRFLMSDECPVHPDYKRRLIDAQETVVTELFGLGWPAPHRVIANEATRRWLRGDERGPAAVRAIERVSAPLVGRLPLTLVDRFFAAQRPGVPLFAPSSPLARAPARLVDASPLYAGETVARIFDVRPAGDLVRELGG